MKIYIGADHRGFTVKKQIKKTLEAAGHEVVDVGTHQEGVDCDYPELSYAVASKIVEEGGARGILICMTGLGHAIAANKIRGAYAAVCYNEETAALSRQHNNSNILVLGAKYLSEEKMEKIIEIWLRTEFEGGRHERRFKQIQDIEKRSMCD
jgi:RpiB/LacA/LacB family sugar-phosphate isomerase